MGGIVNASLAMRLAVGCLVLALSPAVHADPRADYLEGIKRYNAGDMIEAMALLKRGADAGDGDAQAFYAFVLGASDLEEDSVAYYRKSAEQGNTEGMFGLAGKFAQGEGVAKDTDAAWKLYHQAAAKNHAGSINVIAIAYINGGYGLTDDERKSATALDWIRRSADGGYLPAVEAMIKAYREGHYGLTPDQAQAKLWAGKAAVITGIKEDGPKKRRRR